MRAFQIAALVETAVRDERERGIIRGEALEDAARQALEALEDPWKAGAEGVADAITALRAALAEPVQEEEGLIEFLADLQRSRMKYPNNRRMFDGLMSEVDELRRAYAGDGDIRAEAFDVAVCAFRIATEGDSGGNTMLKQAEPVQEPVAWRFEARHIDSAWAAAVTLKLKHPGPEGVYMRNVTPLYAAPPQRKPLPASEIVTMYDESPRGDSDMIAFARAIEAAHGIKENT